MKARTSADARFDKAIHGPAVLQRDIPISKNLRKNKHDIA